MLAVFGHIHLDMRRFPLVQIAPAIPLDAVARSRPAPVFTGKRELGRFRETRLSRAVAPGNQRQPRAGRNRKRDLRANAAESLNGDGREVAAHRLGRAGRVIS
jgi:hypothetical protein